MLTYISIDKLNPHPDNPRKDLGDLTELAASIKARGVLQNLTGVPADAGFCKSCAIYNGTLGKCEVGHDERARPPCPHWITKGAYTVVIGHRRLAAARLAGLTELPCTVTEMDQKTQIATMLLENMQRSDLTPVEQAEGLQMMLDLGESVKAVSAATGLSETTVRRRTKMLQTFGREALLGVQDRPIKMEDYEKLYKIKDEKARAEVFDKLGTPNFNASLTRAVDEQKEKAYRDEIFDLLKQKAVPKTDSEYHKMNTCHTKYFHSRPDGVKDAKSFCAGMTGEWFFCPSNYYTVAFQLSAGTQTDADVAEKQRKSKLAGLRAAARRARVLRMDFAREFRATGKTVAAAESMALAALFSHNGNFNDRVFRELYGIAEPFRTSWGDFADGETRDEAAARIIDTESHGLTDNLLFSFAYCRMESPEPMGWYNQYSGAYDGQNYFLNRLYEHLCACGYVMSDEETALRDGTSELYTAQ